MEETTRRVCAEDVIRKIAEMENSGWCCVDKQEESIYAIGSDTPIEVSYALFFERD